ncbi:MAG: agmatine deiminase family protein [Acidobacteriaceae bacterium]|jgi:agmatine deiminase
MTVQYRMPAEWAPHAATWIAWPHNPDDWPGKFQPIPWVYAEIVRHLSCVEDVHILVNDLAAERRATNILRRGGANLARLHFHHWATDRVWLRDSGPIFVKNAQGDLAVTNWKFNAWAKYSNWHRDDQVPHHVAKLYNLPEIKPEIPPPPAAPSSWKPHRIVLEGGSIDTNGAGVLLTTEECLLSEIQQRNPGLGDETTTQRLLETAFHDYLGIDQTLWLNRGCAGDDTHGHIDDIARFVAPDNNQHTILACVEPNPADENHLPLAENLDRLRSFRNAHGPNRGKPFQIVELPMPAPVIFEGQRLPASYANFYIANSLVLVPTFNDAQDRHALNIIASCFPTRQVVGIHAVDLVWGLGTLHCLTQQQPA